MTVPPETQYAKTEEGYVAYQVFGEGPLDLLFITNWSTNVDAMWEEPSLERYFDRLASFSRVICFDKRGSGVSDPVPLASLPTLDEWMDDARVVMDGAHSSRAAVIGDTEGGPMAILFSATYPERISALVLVNSFARWLRADDYRIGMPETAAEKLYEQYELGWGTGNFLPLTAPTAASDDRFRHWFARHQRLSMPPLAAAQMYRWVTRLDVRPALSSVQAPTLVLNREGNRHYRATFGRYLAEHIRGAKHIELSGVDCYPFHVDAEPVLDEIQEFLTGVRPGREFDRILATVLFTDIVASTERAARVGDQEWLDLRVRHDSVVREHLDRFRGREVKTTGDGFLATFDGPARAVRCAAELAAAVRNLGIEIRAGLHTGEVELLDGDVGGIAVHIAARVVATAPAGGILVSGTVKDLVVGSGIEFADRGVHGLKGVPGEWRLFEVAALPQTTV